MAGELQIVPAGKNVEAQFVEMMVPLYSYGCENKVKKALANLKGTHPPTYLLILLLNACM